MEGFGLFFKWEVRIYKVCPLFWMFCGRPVMILLSFNDGLDGNNQRSLKPAILLVTLWDAVWLGKGLLKQLVGWVSINVKYVSFQSTFIPARNGWVPSGARDLLKNVLSVNLLWGGDKLASPSHWSKFKCFAVGNISSKQNVVIKIWESCGMRFDITLHNTAVISFWLVHF